MKRHVGVLTKARENTAKFDFTKFNYQDVFNVLRKDVKNSLEKTMPFKVEDHQIIFLSGLESRTGFGVTVELDDKYYLMLNLEVCLMTPINMENEHFLLRVSPFNCKLENINDGFDCSTYDKYITKTWRKFLSEESNIVDNDFAKAWISAFRTYCERVRILKQEEAEKRYNQEIEKSEQEYEDAINQLK